MAVACATVFYCILCGQRKESADVHVMTQQRRQNNTIAETIIRHEPTQQAKTRKIFENSQLI